MYRGSSGAAGARSSVAWIPTRRAVASRPRRMTRRLPPKNSAEEAALLVASDVLLRVCGRIAVAAATHTVNEALVDGVLADVDEAAKRLLIARGRLGIHEVLDE